MRGEMRVLVERPIEEVYDFLADIRNERQWSPRFIEAEQITEGALSEGTVFAGRYRGIGPLQTRLLVYVRPTQLSERPSSLSFRSTGPRLDIDGVFTLTPLRRTTQVDLVADFQPRGMMAILMPLMRPLMARQNADAARRLKTALENGAPS